MHNEFGHGFLESAYEKAMPIAPAHAGLDVEAQRALPVRFRSAIVGDLRAELIVSSRVVVELKAARARDAVHEARVQLLEGNRP